MGTRMIGAAALLAALSMALGCKDSVCPAASTAQADLAADRTTFSTALLHPGAAPQDGTWPPTPAGAEEVRFNSGPLVLKAWVSLAPKDGSPRPAVIYAHGGFALGADDWADAESFRAAGFVVMTPCWRGENSNPGSFELFLGELDDLIAAGQYLSRLPYVDKSRIYVAGHSVGGTLAMLAAMRPSPFAAAASVGGSPDPRPLLRSLDGPPPFDPGNTREVKVRSPRCYPGSLRVPLHVFVGHDDPLADANREFAKRASSLGRVCQLTELPGDHFTSLAAATREAAAVFSRLASAR